MYFLKKKKKKKKKVLPSVLFLGVLLSSTRENGSERRSAEKALTV